jgi:hypothetical protein
MKYVQPAVVSIAASYMLIAIAMLGYDFSRALFHGVALSSSWSARNETMGGALALFLLLTCTHGRRAD